MTDQPLRADRDPAGLTLWVTGGAGFIGSNFIHRHIAAHSETRFIVVDCLTYAGNPANLAGVDDLPNFAFRRLDIGDAAAVDAAADEDRPDWIIHFAAESHVDRSIHGPAAFVRTNVVGTFNLLETARRLWGQAGGHFHHVSTDEVYGSLGDSGLFYETTPYDPSSPYSATKAASDHLVRAHHRTYGLPVTITNCSNNYGPRHYPEKLIPLMILNCLNRKPLPVYGQGLNVRDWLFVDDHCDAIWEVACRGRIGETYNIGGDCELRNIDVLHRLIRVVAEETNAAVSKLEDLITFVPDRPGHDLRYAMDFSKLHHELGWSPKETFESGLRKTVQWYLANPEWVADIQSGEYRNWVDRQYGGRVKP
ncbi:MAG: dTDP-glucose 4,6-dehydratase [Fimbriimonadaceae bacterium]|nr:dTDP-glucose 4,6-dehydratase [Fimbriimonadaceae bacterium]